MQDNNNKLAFLVMFLCPLFFSTNIIFGRLGLEFGIEPFTLALLRWTFTAILLLGFFMPLFIKSWPIIRTNLKWLVISGFLAMWICGGIVYLALLDTSATNGVLIYTTSPVMVIILESLFFRRQSKLRELIGVCAAIFGIGYVVFKGEWSNVTNLNFNKGDLYFVLTAFSWALYTLCLKYTDIRLLPSRVQLGTVAIAGVLWLLPISAYEIISVGHFPLQLEQWIVIAAMVLFSSLIAFLSYQYGIRHLGPSIASIFMYLMPIYGAFLAVILLGETMHSFQIIGAILVIVGVVFASFPSALLSRANPYRAG